MAVRKVIMIPDPVLYRISEPVTKFDSELRELNRDMFDTMHEQGGVGLAAVQIGVLKRILVVDLSEFEFIKGSFVNPVVIEQSEEMQDSEEGCLSVPGIAVPLKRPYWVKVGYQDLSGQPRELEAEMLMARALLHEIDHLNGKVFVDLLEPEVRSQIESDLDKIRQGQALSEPAIPSYRRRS